MSGAQLSLLSAWLVAVTLLFSRPNQEVIFWSNVACTAGLLAAVVGGTAGAGPTAFAILTAAWLPCSALIAFCERRPKR